MRNVYLMGYTAHVKVLKTAGGVLLIVIGLLALVTPLTPGAWLMFVGFELIGVRLTLWDKMKAWYDKRRQLRTTDTEPPNSAVTKKDSAIIHNDNTP